MIGVAVYLTVGALLAYLSDLRVDDCPPRARTVTYVLSYGLLVALWPLAVAGALGLKLYGRINDDLGRR